MYHVLQHLTGAEDYDKVTRAHKEATELASRELDTRLALVRSRRDNSGPRYTVASAEEKAASQVQEMQTMELELQRSKQRLAQYKERMKELYKEESRLRSERAQLEKKYGQRSGPNPEDATTRERYGHNQSFQLCFTDVVSDILK